MSDLDFSHLQETETWTSNAAVIAFIETADAHLDWMVPGSYKLGIAIS